MCGHPKSPQFRAWRPVDAGLNHLRTRTALGDAIAQIAHALLAVARRLGESLPEEGEVRVGFDDSIITDTAAEKKQDMAEVAAGLMQPWEYRMRWYGEDEETAKGNVADAVRGA